MRTRAALVVLVLAGTLLAERAEVDTQNFHPEPAPGMAWLQVFDDMTRQVIRHSETPGVEIVETLDSFLVVHRRTEVRRDPDGLRAISSTDLDTGVEETFLEGGCLLLPRTMLERKRHRVRMPVALRRIGGPAGEPGEGILRYKARIRKREAVTCPALGQLYAWRVDFKIRVRGKLAGVKHRRKERWSAWFSTLDGIVMRREKKETKLLHAIAETKE